jgi:hypothetical protein
MPAAAIAGTRVHPKLSATRRAARAVGPAVTIAAESLAAATGVATSMEAAPHHRRRATIATIAAGVGDVAGGLRTEPLAPILHAAGATVAPSDPASATRRCRRVSRIGRRALATSVRAAAAPAVPVVGMIAAVVAAALSAGPVAIVAREAVAAADRIGARRPTARLAVTAVTAAPAGRARRRAQTGTSGEAAVAGHPGTRTSGVSVHIRRARRVGVRRRMRAPRVKPRSLPPICTPPTCEIFWRRSLIAGASTWR